MRRATSRPVIAALAIGAAIVGGMAALGGMNDQPRGSEPGAAIDAPQETSPKHPPAELPRGQLLYENHCQSCHQSTVHIRDPQRRKVRSLAELRAEIVRWAGVLHLDWQEQEVADVLQYLNRRYYQLAPPSGRN